MNISSQNAPTMLVDLMHYFRIIEKDQRRMTRVGPAIEIPGVTQLKYYTPQERVVFSPLRNANPFFHLMESIWIIAGRQDVAFISYFLNNIKQYSDDGIKFNAAYGHRMRSHFGMDQLKEVVTHLESNNRSRQAVINLWDPTDINRDTLDKACNMTLVFSHPDGLLNLTVFNRSNDGWFGAVGANVVQFTQIQELVSIAIGLPMGEYYQVSNNMHLYTDLYKGEGFKKAFEWPDRLKDNRYATDDMDLYRMDEGVFAKYKGNEWIDIFSEDANKFCDDPFSLRTYKLPYFNDVVFPMAMAFFCYKEGLQDVTFKWMDQVKAEDWHVAGYEWLERRYEEKS